MEWGKPKATFWTIYERRFNEKAIKLYEKMGFKKEDETETHYIMEKRIEEKLWQILKK